MREETDASSPLHEPQGVVAGGGWWLFCPESCLLPLTIEGAAPEGPPDPLVVGKEGFARSRREVRSWERGFP